MTTEIECAVVAQGQVVGVAIGPSGRLVCSVGGDGVRVVEFGGERENLTGQTLQSWALAASTSEQDKAAPSGPAKYQRHGHTLCLPMVDLGSGSSKRMKGQLGKHFLYVWSVGDVESKNVRHVSRKVVVQEGVAVKYVEPLLETRTSVRKLAGDGVANGHWVGGFVVVMEGGRVGVVGGSEHVDGATVSMAGPAVGDQKPGEVIGVCTHEGGVRLVMKRRGSVVVEQLRLGEFPRVETVGSVTLEMPENDGKEVDAVGMAGDRVLVVAGRTVYMYKIDFEDPKGFVEPLVTRGLAEGMETVENSSGKKRQKAGSGARTNATTSTVFVDTLSRAYLVRSSAKGLTRMIVFDMMYGSVLWAGTVRGCDDQVTQGVAIPVDSPGNTVDLCLACWNRSIVRISLHIPRASLAAVVGSLCISGPRISASNTPLAEHARAALDPGDGLAVRSKRLGKVKVDLKESSSVRSHENGSGINKSSNTLLQKSAHITWTPAMNSDLEALEMKLATMLKMDGKMNAKAKAELVKTVTATLEKCKQLKLSLASDVSAQALLALIDTKQWKLIDTLLQYSHPRSHAHCTGAALALAEHGQYAQLFSLLRHAPDVSPSELTSTMKCLISGTNKMENESSKVAFSRSISSHANKQLSKLEKSPKSNFSGTCADLMYSTCLAAAAINGFSAKQVACHPLLALHPDAALLLRATKRLHSRQLIFLIRYLLQWLRNITELDVVHGGVPDDTAGIVVPSLQTLLIWLSAVVDAGNMRMFSSDTGLSVLQSLMEEIKLQVLCVKGFGNLTGALDQVHRSAGGRTGPTAPVSAGGYQVEYINF